MNRRCEYCFAYAGKSDSVGCRALSERIETDCPFFKTELQYERDKLVSMERLRETKPYLYNSYYGKDGKYANGGTAKKYIGASEER